MFYAPMFFQTVGFGNSASLYSSVIVGAVNVLSTLVAVVMVDHKGRCWLLLEACIQMFVAQVQNSNHFFPFLLLDDCVYILQF